MLPAVSVMGILASGFDLFCSVNVFWIRRVHRRLHDVAFGCATDEVERKRQANRILVSTAVLC